MKPKEIVVEYDNPANPTIARLFLNTRRGLQPWGEVRPGEFSGERILEIFPEQHGETWTVPWEEFREVLNEVETVLLRS